MPEVSFVLCFNRVPESQMKDRGFRVGSRASRRSGKEGMVGLSGLRARVRLQGLYLYVRVSQARQEAIV